MRVSTLFRIAINAGYDYGNEPKNGSWQCGHYNLPNRFNSNRGTNRCRSAAVKWFIHPNVLQKYPQIAVRCEKHVSSLLNAFEVEEISEEQALSYFNNRQAEEKMCRALK